MVTEAMLMRTSGKITAFIEQYVKLPGAEEKEEVLRLFDGMHLLFPQWVIVTCPMMHPDIHYVSRNHQDVFGYDHEYQVNAISMKQYFSHVPDADQEDLHQCFRFLYEFIQSVPPEQHYQYRGVLHYRFIKPDGQYMHLRNEKAVLRLRGSGNLYYGLYRDITSEKNFSGIKVEIFKQEQSMARIAEYKPSGRSVLTKREGELVTLIKQGLSTKEIAWQLNISHNTVRNIKSKLFEKYQVNNTIELLNMTA